MAKIAYLAGSLLGFSGIILGAFGAHALKATLAPESLDSFNTGARYQLIHALFLLVLGLMYQKFESPMIGYSIWGNLIGVILFSGSIYLLTVFKMKSVALVTPVGGLFMIVSWALLFVFFLTNNLK